MPHISPLKDVPALLPCMYAPIALRAGLWMTQVRCLPPLPFTTCRYPPALARCSTCPGTSPFMRSYVAGYSGLACKITPRFYGVPMGAPVISSSADPMNTIAMKSIKNAMAFENTLAISREPSSLLCGPVGIIKQVPHINNPTIILEIRLESMPII